MGNRNFKDSLLEFPEKKEICDQYNMVPDSSMKNSLSFLKTCTTGIDGNSANSASSSDILFLTDEEGNRIVMKYFLTNNLFYPTLSNQADTIRRQPNYESLVYELQVYTDKIRPLTKHGVCPYFIDFYGGNLNVTYNQMLSFLKECVERQAITEKTARNPVGGAPTTGELKHLETSIQNTFKRNILYMATNSQYRPSIMNFIQGGNPISIFSIFNNPPNVDQEPGGELITTGQNITTGYIAARNSQFINSNFGFMISKMQTGRLFESVIDPDFGFTDANLRPIIFQICIAHYALYLSGISHNDAHDGNIFIEELKDLTSFTYFIEDKRYDFTTRYVPKLYDFDLSYSRGVKNESLSERSRYGMGNVLINGKDFMKSMCYFFKSRPSAPGNLSENLRNLLTKGTVAQKRQYIEDLGIYDNCFFEGTEELGNNLINNRTTYMSRFYTYEQMLDLMANSFGYINNPADNCYDDYKYGNPISRGSRRVYYLSSDVFDSDKNIDAKLLNNYIEDVASVCVNKLNAIITNLRSQINQPSIQNTMSLPPLPTLP